MNGDWLIVAAMVGATVAWGVMHRERPAAPRAGWSQADYERDYYATLARRLVAPLTSDVTNGAAPLPAGAATVSSPHLPFWTTSASSGYLLMSTTSSGGWIPVDPPQPARTPDKPIIMPAPIVEDLPVHEVCTTRETVIQIAQLASRQGKTTSVGQVLADGRICVSIM